MTTSIVVRIQDMRFALPLSAVNRVVSAVEVTRFPAAPVAFLGIIDVAGDVMPVVDLRRRLGIEPRPVEPSDCMLLTGTGTAEFVLPVDAVLGVADLAPGPHTDSAAINVSCIDSILCDAEGLVLEIDLAQVVSAADYAQVSGLFSGR